MSKNTGDGVDKSDGEIEQRLGGVEWVDYDGYALPVLNWCRECWAEAAPMEEPLPDECEECGSTDVTRL